ncbi:MAG: hypothetical protein IKK85_04525 [Clostridia bacterium]|nr:hypothetical protein [Clostridia bacterium]
MALTSEDILEHRVAQLEEKMQHLSDKVNAFAVSQAAAGAKLDSMLVTLSELKESVNRLSRRPVQFWDKILLGFVGAVAAAVAAAIIKFN